MAKDATTRRRENQRRRTRKDLLQAASRLMQAGRRPSLEEVASEAMVSRATAYRYFQSSDHLLAEAALDVITPDADELLRHASAHDVVARVERVDDALHEVILANEMQMRTMLAHSLQRGAAPAGALPARQNRRTPLLEAALAPARARLGPAALRRLTRALSLIVGTEALVVCKDVLQIDDAETRRVKRWAIRALIETARRQSVA